MTSLAMRTLFFVQLLNAKELIIRTISTLLRVSVVLSSESPTLSELSGNYIFHLKTLNLQTNTTIVVIDNVWMSKDVGGWTSMAARREWWHVTTLCQKSYDFIPISGM